MVTHPCQRSMTPLKRPPGRCQALPVGPRCGSAEHRADRRARHLAGRSCGCHDRRLHWGSPPQLQEKEQPGHRRGPPHGWVRSPLGTTRWPPSSGRSRTYTTTPATQLCLSTSPLAENSLKLLRRTIGSCRLFLNRRSGPPVASRPLGSRPPSALRPARGRDNPELLHNAQRIGVDPDLDDLPVRDPKDPGNGSGGGLSGGGERAEVAAQGCTDGATAQAAVRGPEVVLDGEADIRHRLENRREEGLDLVAAPGRAAWGNGVVVHGVWGVELVYEIRAAAVDDFLHVSLGEVCCCGMRHVVPLFSAGPRGVLGVP